MITIRRAHERGRSDAGWLDSRHTFSFAEYRDPAHMGFGALRVINDDWVEANAGFGTHPHRDMEIVTYVLSGALAHRDSMGNGSTIHPGDLQRMSAGTGITHSEWNHSPTDRVHFLQIWIIPEVTGLEPSYEQRSLDPRELSDRLALIASRDGRERSLTIHQDAAIYATTLSAGHAAEHAIESTRRAWVQVAGGSVTLNGHTLDAGDGAAVTNESRIELVGVKDAEVLVFDLA